MGLLTNLTPNGQYRPCKVGRIILELEPDDREILNTALTDGRWTAFKLAHALRDRGITITPDTIRAHMRATCTCSKI